MIPNPKDASPQSKPLPYRFRIRIKGCLSEDLIVWLDLPFQIDLERAETYLFIYPPDQAALYGAILRLRDLGLSLLSVDQVPEA